MRGRKKKKSLLSIHSSKYLKKFGNRLIFKNKQTKTKQPFYVLFGVPRGTLSRLVDAISKSGGAGGEKKIWFLCPSPFSELKFISKSPVGRRTRFRATIAPGQTYSSLSRKHSHNLNYLWEEAQMTVGTLVLHLKFPLGQDKASFISHSNTMEDHSNYDFCHN